MPVWNGLTDEDHPTQVLADFLTAKEVLKKDYSEINFTYVGDGRNNVANALMQGAAIMGMNFHLVCPQELNPTDELLNRCKHIADENGGNILITDDIDKGLKTLTLSIQMYGYLWVNRTRYGKSVLNY